MTTEREDRLLVKCVTEFRNDNAPDILQKLKDDYGIDISLSTFLRRLKENGIKCCKLTKKFMLNDKMIKKRYNWGKKMQREMTDDDYSEMFWTDEMMARLNIWFAQHAYRTKDEKFAENCVTKEVKHPISVMVWGGISSKGVGPLYFVEGKEMISDFDQYQS